MRSLAILTMLLCVAALHAEEIFVKNQAKPIKGAILKESARGVLVGGKEILSEDIVDIHYDLSKADAQIVADHYRPALLKDKESVEKPTGRKLAMDTAIFDYEKTLKGMEAGQDSARRNIEFRIAYLRARETLEFGATPNPAINKLVDFKTKHPDCWQLSASLQMLAELYLGQRDFAKAEKCYQDLSQAPVSEDLKQEAEFLQARMNIRSGEPQKALGKLQALLARLPKNSRNAVRAAVNQAECFALMKKNAEANKIFHEIIKDSPDVSVKAMAHNGLGKNFFDQGLLKEAKWEFLWVDVAYNHDKFEHSKALYYLWQIYSKLNEPDKAQECRDTLLNDRQFNGLEFQRRVQLEAKGK